MERGMWAFAIAGVLLLGCRSSGERERERSLTERTGGNGEIVTGREDEASDVPPLSDNSGRQDVRAAEARAGRDGASVEDAAARRDGRADDDARPRGSARLESHRPVGRLETVALFEGAMPTGVAVSRSGRIFVNFPKWGDDVPFTVGEIRGGRLVPYPSEAMNRMNADEPSRALVSVQSVVVDPRDRLWILDTGSIAFQPAIPGGPKLVCVDLATDRVEKTIEFSRDVALPDTYLNDVRFDLGRGREGMAFITDSSEKGPNGIVVVDLASGASWRRLDGHPSTRAEGLREFLPVVEGRPFVKRGRDGRTEPHLRMGSDGIAIDPPRDRLYFTPLASRHLYSVSIEALADDARSDEEVARTVRHEGDKGGGADGLESDADGTVYATNYEHDAILRRPPNGAWETVVQDPRLLWPDSLALGADGYLYVTANQLHRQPRFQEGRDLRRKPYALFRVRVDAEPVALR